MIEKRKHTRIKLEIKVEIKFSNGKSCQGVSENISFGGLKVNFPDNSKIEKGIDYDLSLILDAGVKTFIKFKCRAVHVNPKGIGMEFLQIDSESYDHFKNLMVANAQDPDKLLEELQLHPGIIK